MPIVKGRTAFGPEALSRFTQILEEVSVDLVGDGLPACAEQDAEGWHAMRSAYLGVDPSQAIWRKSVEAA